MSFIFTTPINHNLVDLKGSQELYIEGHISTKDKDLVNDIVSDECLKSMQSQILDRNIKLDYEHEAFRGDSELETEINKTKLPVGRIIDATIDSKGLRVKAVINKFHSKFQEIKGSIEQKFLDAFSIAYIPTDVKTISDGQEEIRSLNDVRLFNVALTGNPVNTKAEIVKVFMKSMDAYEEEIKKCDKEKLEVKSDLSPKGHKIIKLKTEENLMSNEEIIQTQPEAPAETQESKESVAEVVEPTKVEESKETEEPKKEPEKSEEVLESEEPAETESSANILKEIKSLQNRIQTLEDVKAPEVKANSKVIVENKNLGNLHTEKKSQPLDQLL